ncbi:lasso peptide biosynthesis B2 protein [Sphingomonas pollutisoli]|uniref:lasso peptide biosynthesis B2 protein n=1 Tax=Sphingomonas pollutisoli TaxID=3030829 RepID=UPI0023B95DBC|nr:lasso peptide biosynthesis B2 protein [Sphingomonas pollutisoli]
MQRLKAQLHYCYSGGRAIFLDAADGRYFCLPAVGESAFLAFLNGSANDDQVDWLQSKNIVVEANDRRYPNSHSEQSLPRPSEQLQLGARPAVSDILEVTTARITAMALLKCRGFGWASRSIIAAKARREAGDEGADSQIVAEIASAFQSTDLLMGKTNRCLPRSLAFLRVCIARGHYPSLVIGIRTNPFTAHAWVQMGGKVLNDSVDHVRVFTPIMVL